MRLATRLGRLERGRSKRARGCSAYRAGAILLGDAPGPPWLERETGRCRLCGVDARCMIIELEAVPDRRPDKMVSPAP